MEKEHVGGRPVLPDLRRSSADIESARWRPDQTAWLARIVNQDMGSLHMLCIHRFQVRCNMLNSFNTRNHIITSHQIYPISKIHIRVHANPLPGKDQCTAMKTKEHKYHTEETRKSERAQDTRKRLDQATSDHSVPSSIRRNSSI